MKLTPSQEQAVRDWAAAGASLSDIQTRLASEFDLHPSYMDVRFLVLDLGVTLAEKPAPKPAPDLAKAPAPAEPPDRPAPYDDGLPEEDDYADEDADGAEPEEPAPDAAPAPAHVTVTVSKLAQPGLALNGSVTFSDGVEANWGVTARGELTLAPADPTKDGYRPTQADLRAFQVELRRALTKMGMY